jgi:serine/threonine protein kinase
MNHSQSEANAPLLFGRYRVLKQVGRGRLAIVYQVIDERLQREVLLHVLHPDLAQQEAARQEFLSRIQEKAQCSHPALLDVFDSGEMGGRPYMVTEYLAEHTLYGAGQLAVSQALQAISQVADAILLCQERGLSPPPVSSRHVWRVHEGQVKLVESWLLAPDEAALDQASYRPPEQAPGQPATSASLVYALGLLLYELLTGVRPSTGESVEAIAQAHQNLRILPIVQMRPSLYLPTLERLIHQATAPLPAERLPDVRAFLEEIARVKHNVETHTRRVPVALSPRHQQRARKNQSSASEESSEQSPHPVAAPPDLATAPPDGDLSTGSRQPTHPPAHPRQKKSPARGCIGWFVTLLLLLVVAYGSYLLTSFAVDQLFAIKLPRLRFPSIGELLPEWWPRGDNDAPTLIVNIAEGLNLRDEPGLSSNIIAIVRNGAEVRQIAEPRIVDDVEWVRVRARTADIQKGQGASDQNTIEGWMSRSFLLVPDNP